MRKEIYMAFIERLNAHCTEIKHISLWNDNVSNLEEESGFALPAAFLEFEPVDWVQHARGAKTAQVRVKVHVVIDSLSDPADGSPYMDDALRVFDLLDNVTAALEGMAGDGFGSWVHVGTEPDHNHDEVQHHVESFAFQVSVPSRRPRGTAVENVAPNIKI